MRHILQALLTCMVSIFCFSSLYAQSSSNQIKQATIHLILCVDDAPFSYYNEIGEPHGFNYDLARILKSRLNTDKRVAISLMPWENIIPHIQANPQDIFVGIYDEPEKYMEHFVLSPPYIYTTYNGVKLYDLPDDYIEQSGDKKINVPMCIGVHKENYKMLGDINTILLDIKHSGELDKLINQYFPKIQQTKWPIEFILGSAILLLAILSTIFLIILRHRKNNLDSRQEQFYAKHVETVFDNIPFALYIIDWEGKDNEFVFLCNKVVYDLFDNTKPTKQDIISLFSDKQLETFNWVANKTFQEGSSTSYYDQTELPNGKTWDAHIHVQRIEIQDKYYLLYTSTSILDLNKAREEAEQNNQRMEQFLSTINHEIRTPLNTIVGFSDMLPELPEDERGYYAQLISEKSDFLAKLIEDILLYSKLESDTFKLALRPGDAMNVTRNVRMMYEHLIPANKPVEIVSDVLYDSFQIQIDDKCYRYILDQFILNAIKYTNSGQIRVGWYTKNDESIFYVKDTGVGIPKEKQANVFDRFKKVNEFTPGTGLGAPICLQMVKLFPGGRIGVYSEEEKGSLFWLSAYLPYETDGLIVEDTTEYDEIIDLRWKGIWYEYDELGNPVQRGGHYEA